jgi:threonine aldolase
VDNVLPPDTNILVFKLKNSLNAHQTCQKLAEKGVLGIPFGEGLVRFVTHLDISDNDIDYVESVLRSEVL